MIIFNIPFAKNNFNSFEAIIRYLGKDESGKFGSHSIRTPEFIDYVKFEKYVKKFISDKPATFEVVINKIIWDTKTNHDIINRVYNDPITGKLVMPSADNIWKAHEIYTYEIANNKAKLI